MAKKICGRLSLGSYLEIVSIVAIAQETITLSVNLYSGIPIGVAALIYLYGIVSLLAIGLVSFPVYCWVIRNRRILPLTIVEEEKESGASHGR